MQSRDVAIEQLNFKKILLVWLLAALPMAALVWIVAPQVSHLLLGPAALAKSIFICLTIGLVWQCFLVLIFVRKEQGNLRLETIKQSLWLLPPIHPVTNQPSKKVWWMLIPFGLLFAAESALPSLPIPVGRDLGTFLSSDIGIGFFHHAWGWYGLFLVMGVFNTVLGEELLFRGFLLPRMKRVFKSKDWLANGVLFAFYHLHQPWSIPGSLIDSLSLAYPTKRYRSAWMGIIVHSTQTVLFSIVLLFIVLK